MPCINKSAAVVAFQMLGMLASVSAVSPVVSELEGVFFSVNVF